MTDSLRVQFSTNITFLKARMINDGNLIVDDYVLRSPEEQFRLYQKGRKQDQDGNWIIVNQDEVVTNCDGKIKVSGHIRGIAEDIYFVIDNQIIWEGKDLRVAPLYAKYHEIWENEYNGKAIIIWDIDHFELKG